MKISFADMFVLLAVFVSWLGLVGSTQGDTVGEEWIVKYDGPGHDWDIAKAMVLDSAGNIYVTGGSIGSTSTDYATIKYDPNGEVVWVRRYDADANSSDAAEAMAIDAEGNVYVTGSGHAHLGFEDYVTIKYDPNGNEVWVAVTDSGSYLDDTAWAIDVDAQGNVYVTGESDDYDFLTAKYDPNGSELWSAIYPAGTEGAKDIAADRSGNAYVVGGDYFNERHHSVLVKYGPDGDELWAATYKGAGDGYNEAEAVALDDDGNIYVCGIVEVNYPDTDYVTIKYNRFGNRQWVATYDGPAHGTDAAFYMVLDADGNIYITGMSDRGGTDLEGYDYVTIKYDPEGNELWVARYDGPANGLDYPTDISLDAAGNIYVTGMSGNWGLNMDIATVKYDPNGDELWAVTYDGPRGDDDEPCAVAVDADGNVYVAGERVSGSTAEDYVLIKYSQQHFCRAAIKADFNHDCRVDFQDFVLFTQDWLQCNFDPPAECWR